MTQQFDIQKRKADKAWDQLYARLENDGLLEGTKSRRKVSPTIRAVQWAAAIAVLCVSLVTLYFITQHRQSDTPMLTLLNTDEATLVTTLEDGSVVYLADKAQLEYPQHFAEKKREVSLEGSALFDITGNRERPFFIETEEVRIEVLGTSFHVKNSKNTPFELAVNRGEVRVTTKNNSQSCLVKAGESVTLLAGNLQVSTRTGEDQFAKFTRRILFKDERLGDILNVLNKGITPTPMQTTSLLEERRLTIGFENNTPDEMAYLISLGLGLSYVQQEGVILLSEPKK